MPGPVKQCLKMIRRGFSNGYRLTERLGPEELLISGLAYALRWIPREVAKLYGAYAMDLGAYDFLFPPHSVQYARLEVAGLGTQIPNFCFLNVLDPMGASW